MTPRTGRLLAFGGTLVLFLILGRSLAVLLTDRWWAASISDAAARATTQWILFGWLLDAAAILLASLWFSLHGLLVVRGIASVTVAQRVGAEQVPVAVPPKTLALWAIGIGVLLGTLTGVGAKGWRGAILLASEGVHFNRAEPITGEDLGTLVARLPLWELSLEFALTLTLLGLALTLALYLGTGGIRRDADGVVVHPHSRRHLGGLLALLAVLLGLASLLLPWTAVVELTAPMAASARPMQSLAAYAMFGAGLAVAALSIGWAVRGRNSLLLASWIVLAAALGIERVILPTMIAPSAPVEGADVAIRKATELAWGMHVVVASPSPDTLPFFTGRWEAATLAQVVAGRGGLLLSATAGMTVQDGELLPIWYLAIGRTSTGPEFEAVTLRESAEPLRDTTATLHQIAGDDARLRPDAPTWRPVTEGVPVGEFFRRVMLAWGRQAVGLLRLPSSASVDWNLDPAARAAALLPFASWLAPQLIVVGERPLWIVQGVIPIPRFPLSGRGRWGGEEVAGVAPAFLAVMDPWTGAVELHRDPSANALGEAWARIAGDLIAAPGSLPPAVRDAVPYPRLLFETQLRQLEGAAWKLGRRPGRRVPDGPPEPPTPTWTRTEGAGWQSVMEDPERIGVTGILTATRRDGHLRITYAPWVADTPENGREVERQWNRMPTLSRWRDSARAARDSVAVGTVRWHLGPVGLMAWQPLIASSRFGRVKGIAVATAWNEMAGAAQEPSEAWSQLLTPAGAPAPAALDQERVEKWRKAGEWVARADSALARGDLTAFGRAFEALRALLREPKPE